MSKRQVQKMLQLMGAGEPVELTSAMASVKKLARLAFIAQQFGYEYADVRQGGGRNSSLKMIIVPDRSPQAQARAAQNWAQYPQAGDGVSLPPLVPDAFELLKARINFDLTGKNAEKRMGLGAVGLTVGMAIAAVRSGHSGIPLVVGFYAVLMAILGIGFVVTRKRNAKFAARLQAAGFMRVTEEGGRVRYLPPTAYGQQAPGPYGQQTPGPYGGRQVPGAYPQQAQQTPGAYGQQAPGAYPQQAQQAPGPYGQQAPGAYGQQAPGPYTQPQPPAQPQPGAQPQSNPYGRPQPTWQPPQQ